MAWSENKWTIISALATVLGVIITVLLFVLSRGSKELTVRTLSRAVVVDLTEPELALFKLTYNDLAVNRLTAATIEVSNSGSRPIERTDFERELVIRFLESAPVLAARVAERVPDELRPELRVGSSDIAIRPLLLNPGDGFRLTVHLRGDFAEPIVDARISGVSKIQRWVYSDPLSPPSAALDIVAAFLVSACAFFMSGYLSTFRRQRLIGLPGWDWALVMCVFGMITGVLWDSGMQQLGFSRAVRYGAGIGIPLLAAPVMFVGSVRAQRAVARLRNQHEKTEAQLPGA